MIRTANRISLIDSRDYFATFDYDGLDRMTAYREGADGSIPSCGSTTTRPDGARPRRFADGVDLDRRATATIEPGGSTAWPATSPGRPPTRRLGFALQPGLADRNPDQLATTLMPRARPTTSAASYAVNGLNQYTAAGPATLRLRRQRQPRPRDGSTELRLRRREPAGRGVGREERRPSPTIRSAGCGRSSGPAGHHPVRLRRRPAGRGI